MTHEERIAAFNDTREHSKSIPTPLTRVYTEVELEALNLRIPRTSAPFTRVDIESDTVSAILNSKYKKVTALNFADGYTPGGLVLQGANTQEECLCRCSNLYTSLTQQACKEGYYDYNKEKVPVTLDSTNRIIYSFDVVFFKDKDLQYIDKSVQADVITCPSTIKHFLTSYPKKTILTRMRNIINVAADNGTEELILGAWGCGAFHNSWEVFSKLWNKVLEESNGVDIKQITFAMLPKTK